MPFRSKRRRRGEAIAPPKCRPAGVAGVSSKASTRLRSFNGVERTPSRSCREKTETLLPVRSSLGAAKDADRWHGKRRATRFRDPRRSSAAPYATAAEPDREPRIVRKAVFRRGTKPARGGSTLLQGRGENRDGARLPVEIAFPRERPSMPELPEVEKVRRASRRFSKAHRFSSRNCARGFAVFRSAEFSG